MNRMHGRRRRLNTMKGSDCVTLKEEKHEILQLSAEKEKLTTLQPQFSQRKKK